MQLHVPGASRAQPRWLRGFQPWSSCPPPWHRRSPLRAANRAVEIPRPRCWLSPTSASRRITRTSASIERPCWAARTRTRAFRSSSRLRTVRVDTGHLPSLLALLSMLAPAAGSPDTDQTDLPAYRVQAQHRSSVVDASAAADHPELLFGSGRPVLRSPGRRASPRETRSRTSQLTSSLPEARDAATYAAS